MTTTHDPRQATDEPRLESPQEQRRARREVQRGGRHNSIPRGPVNVGDAERLASLAAGSLLVLMGLRRPSLGGLAVAALGGGLVYRGATGRSAVYSTIGLDTAADRSSDEAFQERGVFVSESCIIDRAQNELYDFWRKAENLPCVMPHLLEVKQLDERRSHWVAKAPAIGGGHVEWDSEITRDEPHQRIEWRSLPGADVPTRGRVTFNPAVGGRGTLVRVEIDYVPPLGALGDWVAKLLGKSPARQTREGLRGFKRLMETGEIPTIEGQSHGSCMGLRRRGA